MQIVFQLLCLQFYFNVSETIAKLAPDWKTHAFTLYDEWFQQNYKTMKGVTVLDNLNVLIRV